MYALRRVLAVRFSLTMFFALLLVALWAFLATQQILRGQLDRSLTAALELEAALVVDRGGLLSVGPADRSAFIDRVNRFVVIRDAEGRILGTNTPLAGDLPPDPEALTRARAGVRSWRTDPWHDGWIRSAYAPIASPERPQAAVIQVAAAMGPVAAVNRNVLLLMLGTVLLGTVATMFGAAWLARAAVQPVVEIQRQAEQIRPGMTGQRISAHADVAECVGLVRVLNRMLERLDQAFEAQRRIIADVGHDLKTPITAIRGELEIALRGIRTPEQYRGVLKSALEEVDHLQSIGEALLVLARIEAGDVRPQPKPTDLGALARQALEHARPRMDGRQVKLVEGPDADLTADVDGAMVGVALDQLLDNVRQHTAAGDATRVEVAVSGDAEAVRLTVADNGPGIPEDALPHLFERFYRVDQARTRGAGAGLGLSVASAIVTAHRGTTHAARSRLGGLEVGFTLPRNGLPDAGRQSA